MRIEHLFDSRRRHTSLETRDDAAVDHERERGNRVDAEPGRDVRTLVDVDLSHRQMLAFLPRDVREQALHAPGGPGPLRGEEHEEGPVVLHV